MYSVLEHSKLFGEYRVTQNLENILSTPYSNIFQMDYRLKISMQGMIFFLNPRIAFRLNKSKIM